MLLPDQKARLWYLLSNRGADPEQLRRYQGYLAASERARQERFRFERDGHVREDLAALAPILAFI